MSSRLRSAPNLLVLCSVAAGFWSQFDRIAVAQAVAKKVVGESPKNDENPHVWKSRTTAVSVFKNGMGFFLREGDVALRDGWCVAEKIPPASFGTLATFSHADDQVVDIVGAGPGEIVEFDGIDAPQDVASKRKRLTSVENLKVALTYEHKGDKRTAAGRLVSVGPEFAVLDDETNSFAVPLEGISKLQLLDLPLRIHVSADEGKPIAKTKLGMAYLRKGITWIPEYSLKILDEKTAELTLRGTIVNEAEDLVHCDVHLVVGVPHFTHTNYMAPIAVGQTIRTIGSAVAPPGLQSQIMSRAAIVSNTARANQFIAGNRVQDKPIRPDGGNLDKALGNLPKLDGGAGSDFTVYTRSDMTLRRGEKAIVTLFKRKISYSHTYHWRIPNRLEHSLLLHNDDTTAWTTGPCLTVSGVRPLSEDLLKYTPKGGAAQIPVATAVNIAHRKTEREVDRDLKQHSPSSNSYLDLVYLEGRLELKNFEKRATNLTIAVPVPGKPTSASDEASIAIDPTKLRLLERAGTVEWSLTLKPGESKVLTYAYQRYVPSR